MNKTIAIPIALSLLAGVTDVTTWLILDGFFSAHVTGNLVVAAADVTTGTHPNIIGLLAIPAFIVTSAVSTSIARHIGANRSRVTRVLFGAQAAFLLAASTLSFSTRASAHPQRGIAIMIGLCAVCSMATQNAYLHIVPPRPLSTAVMTGNLVAATIAATDILQTRGASPDARARWTASWPPLAGFTAGCFIGARGATLFNDHATAIPALLAIILFIVVLINRDSKTATGAAGQSQVGAAALPRAERSDG